MFAAPRARCTSPLCVGLLVVGLVSLFPLSSRALTWDRYSFSEFFAYVVKTPVQTSFDDSDPLDIAGEAMSLDRDVVSGSTTIRGSANGILGFYGGVRLRNVGIFQALVPVRIFNSGGGGAGILENRGSVAMNGPGVLNLEVATTGGAAWLANSGHIEFRNGSAAFQDGTSFSASSGNHVSILGGASFEDHFVAGGVILGGGVFVGKDTGSGKGAVVSGQASWQGGVFSGTWQVGTDGQVDQVGDGGQAMRDGKMEVSGELVLRGAGLAAGEGFALTVAIPGRISLVGDQSLIHNTGAAPLLTNFGRVTKVSGTGSSTLRLPFHNHGVLDVQAGYLDHDSSDIVFGAGTQFSGAGANRILGAAHFQGEFQSDNLEICAGSSTTHWDPSTAAEGAPSPLAVGHGKIAWTTGGIGGVPAFDADAVLDIRAPGANAARQGYAYLDNSELQNRGSVQLHSSLYLWGNAVIRNQGTMALQGDHEIRHNYGDGAPRIENSGDFSKRTGTGESHVAATFVNDATGTVAAAAGALVFERDVINRGSMAAEAGTSLTAATTMNNVGALAVGPNAHVVVAGETQNPGSILVSQQAVAEFGKPVDNSGSLVLRTGATAHATSDLTSSGSIDLGEASTLGVGGTLHVTETGTVNGTGTIHAAKTVVDGKVRPGHSPGNLRVEGALSFGAASVLEIEIGGPAVGQYDQLSVAGALQAGGTLQVFRYQDYQPSKGDRFVIVDATTVTGTFAAVKLVGFGDGIAMSVTPSAVDGKLTLEVVSAPAAGTPGPDASSQGLDGSAPNGNLTDGGMGDAFVAGTPGIDGGTTLVDGGLAEVAGTASETADASMDAGAHGPDGADGGCGCHLACPSASSGLGQWSIVLIAAVVLLHRRRRR